MIGRTQSEDGVLAQLGKALRKKPIPAADCPQCGAKDVVTLAPGLPRRQSFGGGADYTFGVRGECGEVCGLTVTLVSLDGDLSTHAYGFPRPQSLSADDIVVPPHIPASVDFLFGQARHNFLLRNWDPAGMTYRKTLEMALRAKFGIERGNLASIIARVSICEPSIFQFFAWMTRVAGNEAAHAEQFSEQDALLLDRHVEQLVVYLLTVPEVKAGCAIVAVRAGAGDAARYSV